LLVTVALTPPDGKKLMFLVTMALAASVTASEVGERERMMPVTYKPTETVTVVPPPDIVTVPLYEAGPDAPGCNETALMLMETTPVEFLANGLGEALALNQLPPAVVLTETLSWRDAVVLRFLTVTKSE
jgi:hypothetical protein